MAALGGRNFSIESLCRLCLSSESSNVHIFSETGNRHAFQNKIWKHFQFWVHPEDDLPKALCQLCCCQLENYHTFVLKVEEVQTNILNMVSGGDCQGSYRPVIEYSHLKVSKGLDHQPAMFQTLEPAGISSGTEMPSQGPQFYDSGGLAPTFVTQPETLEPTPPPEQKIKVEKELANHAEKVKGNNRGKSKRRLGRRSQRTPGGSDGEADSDGGCESSISPEPRKTKLSEQLSQFYNYTCPECSKDCSSYAQLDKHFRKLHNGKAFVICCEQRLTGRMKLIGHMLQHVQPGMYKCPECGKQMASEANLSKHALRHLPNKDRPFKCLTCGKVFASNEDLLIHDKFHLPEAQRESCLCDYCGKKFSNPANLIAHQRYVHLQQRRAICHVCARTYPNQSTLKAHMYTHNAKASLQCGQCGKWLKSILTLRTHMKCHGTELFPCPTCGKVFNYPQSLRHHLRSQHSDQRPHQCPHCSKSFKLKKTLKSHLNQHTGEKPYQCPFCPKNFANSGNFYTHKKRMHTDQDFTAAKPISKPTTSEVFLSQPPLLGPPVGHGMPFAHS